MIRNGGPAWVTTPEMVAASRGANSSLQKNPEQAVPKLQLLICRAEVVQAVVSVAATSNSIESILFIHATDIFA